MQGHAQNVWQQTHHFGPQPLQQSLHAAVAQHTLHIMPSSTGICVLLADAAAVVRSIVRCALGRSGAGRITAKLRIVAATATGGAAALVS